MREQELKRSQNDGGQVVIGFTIEINYLMVCLFCGLVRPFRIYICSVQFFGCTISLVYGIAKKSAMASSNSFTIF